MSKEDIQIGQVRYYSEPGTVSNDWRVVQETYPDGRVCGGYVEQTEDGQYFVKYLTYGTWVNRLIGDLIMTWNKEQLDSAVKLGESLRKR